jgi:hypothetical protein
MREDDLLRIQHIGDVIDVLQTTAHHLYEPDELLTVIIHSFLPTNTQVASDDAYCYKLIVEIPRNYIKVRVRNFVWSLWFIKYPLGPIIRCHYNHYTPILVVVTSYNMGRRKLMFNAESTQLPNIGI